MLKSINGGYGFCGGNITVVDGNEKTQNNNSYMLIV